MSFSEGFASGAQVGDRIKQRILEKKMRELEQTRYDSDQQLAAEQRATADTRYTNEQIYRQERDKTGDAIRQQELAYRAGRDAAADNRYAGEQQYRRGRDAIADQHYAGEQSRRAQGDIMGQLDRALTQSMRQREIAAKIKQMEQGRGTFPYGYQQSTMRDADGNQTITRIPIQPGAAPQTSGALPGRMGQMPAGIQQQYQQQGGPPAAQISPQDQQALAWAKANANDPRAAAILQRLGGR